MNRKTLGALLVTLVFVVLVPGRASATFHLVKVVEVFPGTTSTPTAQYVVLQMYFAGQTLVSGHSLKVFDGSGGAVGTFTFSHNLANGANLATMLIATPDAVTVFGVTADLMIDPVIQPGGGAVCWDVVDCVAWGSFSASSPLPHAPGTPFNVPDGLTLDMAMHRNLSSGGAVTDFAFAPPAPKNNAGQTGVPAPTPTTLPTATPTSTDCGNGSVDVGEECDDGGVCIGGSNAGTVCTADSQCIGSGVCGSGIKVGVVCNVNADCPDSQCVHCVTFGGDGCASNCTVEREVPFNLVPGVAEGATIKPGTSGVVTHADILTIPSFLVGSQTLTIGSERGGRIPVVVKSDSVKFPAIALSSPLRKPHFATLSQVAV